MKEHVWQTQQGLRTARALGTSILTHNGPTSYAGDLLSLITKQIHKKEIKSPCFGDQKYDEGPPPTQEIAMLKIKVRT